MVTAKDKERAAPAKGLREEAAAAGRPTDAWRPGRCSSPGLPPLRASVSLSGQRGQGPSGSSGFSLFGCSFLSPPPSVKTNNPGRSLRGGSGVCVLSSEGPGLLPPTRGRGN